MNDRPSNPSDEGQEAGEAGGLLAAPTPAGERLAGLESANASLMAELAERLRAQQETEARLRFAARAGRMGIWEYDLETEVLTASSIFRQNFGRRPDEPFTYADLCDAIHPDDRARVLQATLASLNGGGDHDIEYRAVRPDGTVAWIEVRAQVLRAADGRPIRMAGISVDITERRRAADELRRTTALLGGIVEHATGLIYAKDTKGRMMLANAATMALIGKPWAEVEGRSDIELLEDKQQAAVVMQNDQAVMQSGRTQVLEEHVATPDGAERLWLSTKSPLRDSAGEVIGLVGVSIDITERKRAEQTLQALNETLEQRVFERTRERDRTWNNARDILLVLDSDGVIRAANPAWTQVLGWSASECIGRRTLDFVHPDDVEVSMQILRQTEASPAPIENRYRTRGGDHRWISWVATLEDGMVYASGRHVTAEKEAAAALARTEEALRQAQKMEAVGQLTGGIAHDFNNLLTGIIGSLTLLTRRVAAGQTADLERYTTAATTSAQRAAALTQRLLAFARRQPLDPRRVDANRLVADMEDLIARTVGPEIEVRTVLAAGLWATLCDPNQLEGALLNLVINARDAMPQGGMLRIETSNTRVDQGYADAQGFQVLPGHYVTIAVGDTGIGMSQEVSARVFEPFFTTKPTGQGTGLGLSMLYGFVRQSNGHVQIDSVVGQGTTFRLYLPRNHGPAQDRIEELTDTETQEIRAVHGDTVLVVDDEAVVRMLVVETLQDLGYAAIEAGDGHAGLALLQSDARVDLLVTDVGLPGLNGRQLAEAARQLRPGLPVLFITGYAHNAAVGQGEVLEQGMEIITKPFSVDGLAFKIREMIESNRVAKRA